MRKALLTAALLFCILFGSVSASAQLVAGDIAFTRYNSNPLTSGVDNFSFVVLRTGGIAAGTVIKFTDRGYAGNPAGGACGTNSWGATAEEEIVFTVGASALPYGRIVDISGLTALNNHNGSSAGTVTGTAMNLSAGGDQLFAYQGLQTAPTMIAGIHMNFDVGITTATNWDNVAAPSGTQSSRPPCLTNGTHALFISDGAGNEYDNAEVKSNTVLSGNPATDRSRINNAANWVGSDVQEFLPGHLAGLPVSFSWIKAYEQSNAIQVEWGISLEEQVESYTIERSADGRTYSEIGNISATGRSLYTFTDATPLAGTNFYRIRATELSQNKKYSAIAIVNRSKTGKGIGVYPNLVRTQFFNLQIMNLPAGTYKLNMVNASGQVVLSRNIMHAGGNGTQSITLPGNITKGMYRIIMNDGNNESFKASIVVE